MSVCADTHYQVRQWLDEALQQENFKDLEVDIRGTSEKGDGYLGDIIFAHVLATRSNDQTEEFNFVVKIGKDGKELRAKFPVRMTFERETFMYSTVIPAFQKFLLARGCKPLNYVAKCFGNLMLEDREVIIFQNLKKLGYELHDRKTAFNLNHLTRTLEAYGRFHALSFAMRDQDPKQYEKLSGSMECVWTAFHKSEDGRALLRNSKDPLVKILVEHNETGLLEKYNRLMKDGINNVWQNALDASEEYSVICHGDCWNNNFMFTYEAEDTLKQDPLKVAMLDFQMARVASPVFDLSYHIYMVSSEELLKDFPKILKIYHDSLSNEIRQLGSDPDKLFPFSTLLDQWRKHCVFGLIISGNVLPLTFTEKEDTISVEDMGENTIADSVNRIKGPVRANLEKRIIAFFKNALDFLV
ncbi:uncharacterized protein LOC132696215 [Cylas formicarius]|uniref:uncharacterized protein LOC132696215 n=1 Tax=Cylas formicarius TaxID=197179 RepID=UPI00295868B4|nr:uncharacterized protein LOC132696215 [Cylas formicarius]XP_060516910.1 uncharacterized protein LOC132696215 [Cylas formicarius]